LQALFRGINMGLLEAIKPKKKRKKTIIEARGYAWSSHGQNPTHRHRNNVIDVMYKDAIDITQEDEKVLALEGKLKLEPNEDDSTLDTDANTLSDMSGSMCRSVEHDFDMEFGEIRQSGSADSYFSSSMSSISSDGRDDTQSSSNERDNTEDVNQSNNLGLPPRSPNSSVSTSSEDSSNVSSQDGSTSSSKSKAQPIKSIRRSASKDSKNYVHIYHNQLTTLKEQPSNESSDINDDDSSDNDCFYGIGQRYSFMASFDEQELRDRWNHSLTLYSRLGLSVGEDRCDTNEGSARRNEDKFSASRDDGPLGRDEAEFF